MNVEHLDTAPPAVPAEFIAVGAPIAAGSSAVVWRAQHRVSGREVALKVWHRPLGSERERAHFEAESRRHQRLSDHPHIVRWLWAAAPADGPPWMATELHGQALAELLVDGRPLPLAQGVNIGLDLLDGLAEMHTHGLVHRDVKPENLLIKDGRAALCDLGIAMEADSSTRDTCAGSAPYLAPELARSGGDRQPDYRSDVYSAARTIRRAVGNDVPAPLHQLLTRAASEEPADRPVDAADFGARLRRVADALGLAPATPAPPPVTPGRRWVYLAAAVLLVAAAGVVVLLLGQGDGGDVVAPVVIAAAAAPADIDAQGRPVELGQRSGGSCLGDPVAGGRFEHLIDGRLIAVTSVYYDPDTDQACAVLTKDNRDAGYGRSSFLALTLCNADGVCDSDWFRYPREAGPVSVQSLNGCVSWRASIQDAEGSTWLVRDAVRRVGC